jgi:cobalt-zinc-cadmium efflux system outer membrane protein
MKTIVRQSILILFVCASVSVAQQMNMPMATASKYWDAVTGNSVDDLVKLALENNGELEAMRKEAAAAEQLIKQAGLRPNPTVDLSGTKQLGGSDNSRMVQGELPLELGGRRAARIRVAQRELEIRQQSVAERGRQLATEVRIKYGEVLAAIFKLMFTESMLANAEQNYSLTLAKVNEGRTPPLEANQELVELNRIRAERESGESAVETKMFELRNLVGMPPDEPLKLKGTLDTSVDKLPVMTDATARALQTRPDLAGARAVEALAAAKVEQARSEGRVDSDLMLGYQRMHSGFPLLGIEEGTGALLPIDSKMHFFTFGVKLMLPVRDRKQGEIAAAKLEEDAASSRRAFGELTIRREVASAYARYERAVKAREIYRLGVRDQALANLGVVRQTYELGSKTLLDYIAEHHRYIETENGYIDAQLEAYLAHIDVLRATNAPELVNK